MNLDKYRKKETVLILFFYVRNVYFISINIDFKVHVKENYINDDAKLTKEKKNLLT